MKIREKDVKTLLKAFNTSCLEDKVFYKSALLVVQKLTLNTTMDLFTVTLATYKCATVRPVIDEN